MSRKEALLEVDQIIADRSRSAHVTHEEVACQDMKTAAQLLSAVLAELRGSDGLYRQRGRRGFLAPPPGRVPPA
jgi:hypothetical protein